MSNPERPWWDYVQRMLDQTGYTTSDLVKTTSISHARLSRWREGVGASVDTAREVAKFFGVSLLETLVAAEVITPQEAGIDGAPSTPTRAPLRPSDLSNFQLANEVSRRLTQLDQPTRE